MREMRKVMTKAGLLFVALLPIMAAVPRDEASPTRDTLPPARVPVAIAQPLGAMSTGPLVAMPSTSTQNAMMPESGMLVLVGSALLGLASLVRRTTRT